VAASALLRARYLRHLQGSAAVLAFSLVLTCVLAAVHLVPGALGILSRGAVAVTAVVALGLTAALHRRPPRAPLAPERAPAPPSPRPAIGAAVLAVALVALYFVAILVVTRPRANTTIDALTFDVPGLAKWIQDGSMWSVHFFAPGWSFGNYPLNGELVGLSVVLPWRGDAFLRFVYAPYLLLTGLAAYGLARELGAARAAAASAGATLAAMPLVMWVGVDTLKPDPLMYATFLTGALFLLRHHRTRAQTDLVLAGLGFGFAMGTKWYGVSAAVIVAGVWLLARLVSRETVGRVARDAALAFGVAASAGGFWMLRNLVESGNPVFPQPIRLLGVTIFDAPHDWRREELGRTLVHYVGDWGVWEQSLLPDARKLFALPAALAAVAVLAALVAWVRRRVSARAGLVALTAVVLLAVYVITPYTAQGPEGRPLLVAGARYAVPALALGLALAGLLASAPRAGLAVQIALLVAIVDGLLQVDDAGARVYFREVTAAGVVLRTALIVLAVGAVAVLWRRGRPSRSILAGAGVIGAVTAVALAGLHQDRFYDGRYRGVNPVTDYVIENAPSGKSFGIAGHPFAAAPAVVPILPLYGPHFGNDVEFLGQVVQHQLQRSPGRAEFFREVRERGFDYLAIQHLPKRMPPEDAWARALGYRPVVRADLWDLYARGGDSSA
jgi:hypothetical protein